MLGKEDGQQSFDSVARNYEEHGFANGDVTRGCEVKNTSTYLFIRRSHAERTPNREKDVGAESPIQRVAE